MGWRISSSLLFFCGSVTAPALAEDRFTSWNVPTTRFVTVPPGPSPSGATRAPVAAFPDVIPQAPKPVIRPAIAILPSRPVAAFPDVMPERPKPPMDPVLALLASNPYESQLLAHKIAVNLYGEDKALPDPYADDRALVNPYSEGLELASPYVGPEHPDNPRGGQRLPENPYASGRH